MPSIVETSVLKEIPVTAGPSTPVGTLATIRKPGAVWVMPAPTDGHNRKDASYRINTSIIRGVSINRDTSSSRDISTVGKPEGHSNNSK